MKQQTVYIPVSVNIELPIESDCYGVYIEKNFNGEKTFRIGYASFSFINSDWKWFSEKNEIVTYWLKELENAIVFTPEELLALKKQVASDAFDAAIEFNTNDYAFGSIDLKPNKEQYLNTITNE